NGAKKWSKPSSRLAAILGLPSIRKPGTIPGLSRTTILNCINGCWSRSGPERDQLCCSPDHLVSHKTSSMIRCTDSLLIVAIVALALSPLSAAEPLKLEKGDHVVIIGNTLAERMNYF